MLRYPELPCQQVSKKSFVKFRLAELLFAIGFKSQQVAVHIRTLAEVVDSLEAPSVKLRFRKQLHEEDPLANTRWTGHDDSGT